MKAFEAYTDKMMNGEQAEMPNVITEFELAADDQVVEAIDYGYGVDQKTGKFFVEVRYDLPESTETLSLRPVYESGNMGEENEEIYLD